MNSSYYKSCVVPQCKSTTIKTPNKLFIYVPNNEQIRKKWLNLARRNDAHRLSRTSRLYFCADHFDLPNDMANYMQYHVMGTVSKVRMKPGCTPRKFECQEDRRKRTCGTIKRSYPLKKQRMMTIAECLNQSEESYTPSSPVKDKSVPESALASRINNQDRPKPSSIACSMSVEIVRVKEEPKWDENEAAPDGLRTHHNVKLEFNNHIKVEIDVEPEVLQPQDVVYSVSVSSHQDVKQEPMQSLAGGVSVPMIHMGDSEDTLQPQLGLKSHSIKLEHSQGDEPKRYPCKTCHKSFKQKCNLISHDCIHFEDETCSKNMLSGIANNVYFCDICKKDFVRKKVLIDHIKTHNEDKVHTCQICNKQFTAHSSLEQHTVTHMNERVHSCDICNKEFKCLSTLVIHRVIHTGEKPHSCEVCDEQFTQKSNLASHMKIHSGEKPFKCNICNKEFRRNNNLKQHKLLHSGDKPHSCQICNKQFTQKSHLTKHMYIHTGEKPFSCTICCKQFRDSSGLKRHSLLHTGEKPHSCQICGQQFTQKYALVHHMRIHLGKKPFPCDICDKRFRRKSAVIRHKRIHFKT